LAARKSKAPRSKAAAKITVPRGYERIAGFGESWPGKEPKPGMTLEGTITEFGEFESSQKVRGKVEKRTVQTAKIEAKDGKLYTLYESAQLRGLFEYEAGCEVFIVFNGYGEAKRGQSAPKLFDVYIR
jgi:hypothetical protein